MLRSVVRLAAPEFRRAAGTSDEALLSAPRRNSATSLAGDAAGPRGAREGPMRRRLPRGSAGAGDRSAADTMKPKPGELDRPHCAAGSEGARGGGATAGQSKPSLNSNCQKTRRKQFRLVKTTPHTLRMRMSLTLAKSRKDLRSTQWRNSGEDRRYL